MKVYTGSVWASAYINGSDFVPKTGGNFTGDLSVDTDTLFVDVSTGNVGIGTDSPDADFHVQQRTNGTTAMMLSAAGASGAVTGDAKFGFKRAESEVTNAAYIRILENATSDFRCSLSLGTRGVNTDTEATERMRIDSAGNLLVGTTTGANRLTVSDSTTNSYVATFVHTGSTPQGVNSSFATSPNNISSTFFRGGDATATRFTVRSNGGIVNYQANDVNLSDRRAKKDIVDSDNYLAKICGIPVRNFRYKDQNNEKHHLGVIAQEVETVAPELVDKESWDYQDEKMDAVFNTDFMFAMMKAIQEQQELINTLTARLDLLDTN